VLKRRGFLGWIVGAGGMLAGLGPNGIGRAAPSPRPSPAGKPGAGMPASAKPVPVVSASPAAAETSAASVLARATAAWLAGVLPKARLTHKETLAVARAVQEGFGIDDALRNLPRQDLPAPDFVFAANGDIRP
jgi:hypothetical protein